MAILVSTAGQPGADQADYWRYLVSTAFGPLHVEPPDRAGFVARLRSRALGSVVAAEVDAPAHTVWRTPRQVARESREYYKLGLLMRGSCVLRQNGGDVTVPPGGLVLYDLTRPVEIHLQSHRIFTVMVPHRAIPLAPDRVAELPPAVLTQGPRSGRLVTTFLAALAGDGEAADGPHAHHLGEAIIELLAGALSEQLGAAAPEPVDDTELLREIKDWIERRLPDPDLSPETIAKAHHISVRQLYRVFQAEGCTVARYVRGRRLEGCRRDLRDPLLAGQPIGAIAVRRGFPDAASFSRMFRAAYGISPSDHRRGRRL